MEGWLLIGIAVAIWLGRKILKPKQRGRKSASHRRSRPGRPPAPQGAMLGWWYEGKPQVLDGDSLRMAGREIRLYGIDAPEMAQQWGPEAKAELQTLCKDRTVRIKVEDTDLRYDRLVYTGFVGTSEGKLVDINRLMVRRGFAWAYTHFSERYTKEEKEAQRHRRAMHSTKGQERPWDYRRRLKEEQERSSGWTKRAA